VGSVVVDGVEIVPVLDAVGDLCELADAYPEVPAEAWESYRPLYPELFSGTQWRLPVAVHLLRANGTTVLVDTGVGPAGLWDFWSPEREGLLPDELDEIGVRREDVDVVFLTHLHVDHVGWNTDHRSVVFFPRARYLTHPDALAFALQRAERPHIVRCLEPLAERIELVEDGAELAPGVRARALPGHYPGHMGVSIRSGDARAELIADIAPHPALLDQPAWAFAYDDIEQTSTRAELVEEVLDTDCVVVCGHFPGSGIGRVVSRDGRVVWEELA
jgi:glyoxylase-like metal-dependent hydrolase (beta-lactamase superfamily II)